MAQRRSLKGGTPTSDHPRASPATSNAVAVAGIKRKRPEPKFYAVREGKKPGIYFTWDDCLSQVRGHKGALFKAFTSLQEAQAFVDGQVLNVNPSGEQKYYAVQNGKVPGVYMTWDSAREQIRGVRNPKHKKFNTKQEAEAFVKAGQKTNGAKANLLSLEDQLEGDMYERSARGMVLNGTHAPTDKEGNVYELGRGPLPPGADDNFDPNIKLSPGGTIVHKTEDEKRRTKMMTKERDPPGMLRIYTDGSSLRNGQAGARAGVGVFFGPGDAKYDISPSSSVSPSPYPSPRSLPGCDRNETVYTIDWVERCAFPPPKRRKPWLTSRHPRNVSEALKGSRQTNQRAELTAILRALDIAPRHREVTIYTDSRYAIDCVTNWYKNWVRNGWMNAKGKPVENKDLISEIRERMEERESLGKGTWFVWVKGHANDEGNIAADKLAVEGAAMGRGVTPDVEKGDREGTEGSSDDGFGIRGGSEEDGEQEVEDAYAAMARAMGEGDEGEDVFER